MSSCLIIVASPAISHLATSRSSTVQGKRQDRCSCHSMFVEVKIHNAVLVLQVGTEFGRLLGNGRFFGERGSAQNK